MLSILFFHIIKVVLTGIYIVGSANLLHHPTRDSKSIVRIKTIYTRRLAFPRRPSFVHDCLLYRPTMDSMGHCMLDQDLAGLTQWADSWEMKYNRRHFIMTITNNKNPPQHFYSLYGFILIQVHDTQYLGITISIDLRSERHTAAATAKVNHMIGMTSYDTNILLIWLIWLIN